MSLTTRSPYRFVRIPGIGSVDLNKWRVFCRECDHTVTEAGDFCEHLMPASDRTPETK